jgi:dTDP-4-amino-4,6-dideoxygalactose transaminase
MYKIYDEQNNSYIVNESHILSLKDPSLNTIEYTKGQKMPISEQIASRILCLPLYVGLESQTIELISRITNE